MEKLGYRAPFVLMTMLGVFFVAHYYIPHPLIQKPGAVMLQWKQPLGAVMLLVAALSLLWIHAKRVVRRERRYGYSLITLLSAGAMVFAGMAFGMQEGSLFADWFENLVMPLESTMFSLLAFFVASAAFRAFRARSASATVLLVSAAVVILALIPAVESNAPIIRDSAAFLIKYPNTAAKRAILIGVALGFISVAIKTIVGIDKTILKKGR
jgi:hypothetical protein